MVKINEINMDREAHPITNHPAKNITSPHNTKNPEGVTVSKHLSQLANMMEADSDAPSANAVAEAKQKIQSGNYSVDYNALSDQLLNSGVLSGT